MSKITFIELQASNDGTVGILANTQYQVDNQEQIMTALSAFHQKCASAAISSCDVHTVEAVDSLGQVWRDCYQVFYHAKVAE